VLDVATGSGDVLVSLNHRMRRSGVTGQMVGLDISATAIEECRRNAERDGADVLFEQRDVLHEPLSATSLGAGGFDVVMCSLFIHHLSREQAVRLLARMREAATRLVIVCDLLRCRAGLLASYAACFALTTSHVVRTDGPRSVRAAFTLPEAARIADDGGMPDATIKRCWPWRWCLTWCKS